MLKLQTIVVAVSGETDEEIKSKTRAALTGNSEIVDFTLAGQPRAPSSHGRSRFAGGIYRKGDAFDDHESLDRYLVWTEQDVHAVLAGPYGSEEERLIQARLLRDRDPDDGIYRLDVPAGTKDVALQVITGEEIEQEDLVTEICRSLARGDQNWAQIATSDHLTFQFMGEEVLVKAEDRLTVATVLKQNLYLMQGQTQDYVITGMRLGTVFTMDMWRSEVTAEKTTAGYEQWLSDKAAELDRVCYAFPGKI